MTVLHKDIIMIAYHKYSSQLLQYRMHFLSQYPLEFNLLQICMYIYI